MSIPHSGEEVPPEAHWLQGLPEPVLMCDVDRYVDQLYLPIAKALGVQTVVTRWHRYVVDLNRLPEDVDHDSVVDSQNPSGQHTQGLHWVKTTRGTRLMHEPISRALHNLLVQRYFDGFHREVEQQYQSFKKRNFTKIYHIDAHSMPSLGTSAHRDPGQQRADIVVSDFNGKSCDKNFADLVRSAYQQAGFTVAYNWPYIGGRVTQTYGQPQLGQQAIQVELNRKLYMDEESKQLRVSLVEPLRAKLKQAVESIGHGLEKLLESP